MLAGTHLLAGVAIYEFSPGPWWLRLPLVGVGGYASHYLLDSAASYHRCWPDSWGDVGLLWVQAACVSVVLGVMAYREWAARRAGVGIRQPGSGALGRLSGQNRSTVLSKPWRQPSRLVAAIVARRRERCQGKR
jgi:hypothetical protein